MPRPKLINFKEVCPENPNILLSDPRCKYNINKKFINFPTPTPPGPPGPPGPAPGPAAIAGGSVAGACVVTCSVVVVTMVVVGS